MPLKWLFGGSLLWFSSVFACGSYMALTWPLSADGRLRVDSLQQHRGKASNRVLDLVEIQKKIGVFLFFSPAIEPIS